MSSHLLLLLNVPVTRVLREVKEIRDNRYQLLREYFRGQEAAEPRAGDPRPSRNACRS